MNDRFKFRVWNKEQNRFHHSFCCDITASGTLVISQGIEGKKYIVDDDNYVVQQSTGLKDKNGKLIYEGDIVVFYFDNDEMVGVISWSPEYQVGFYVNTTDYFKDKYVTDYELLYGEKYEVIGHIYENPELLEGEE